MDSSSVNERYHRPSRLSKRQQTVLGTLGVVALTAVVSIIAWPASNPSISSAVVGYTVVSNTQVKVEFEVVKPAAEAAVCTIQAVDINGAVVGTRNVPIPADPGGPKSVTLTEPLQTSAHAIDGEVTECDLTS
jgi:Domain of unknown function (DUF4307)